MNERDHYQILGLVPDAEAAVIRAAYRALAVIYHPDKNSDEHDVEKMQLINAAYEVLSDPNKRKQYDASCAAQSHNATSVEFDNERPFSTSPIDNPWSVATDFYRNIDSEASDLQRISWRLSFAFKLELLEGKNFGDSAKIAKKLKAEYLSRYFGTDKNIQAYAEQLIKAGRKDAALYLNEIVNVMGSSVPAYSIQRQIESRFSDLKKLIASKRAYSQIVRSISSGNNVVDVSMAIYLVEELHGGIVKRHFFSSRVDVELDGESMSFKDSNRFCQFVLDRYSVYA